MLLKTYSGTGGNVEPIPMFPFDDWKIFEFPTLHVPVNIGMELGVPPP